MSSLEIGEVFGLLSALSWGGTGLLVRAHGGGMHAIVINALRCAISGGVFVVAWPFISSREPVPTAAWIFLLTSTVMGLGIGDSLYFEALKRIGVARAMPISMGYPVLSAVGAVLLLHETLGPLSAVGILLTLGGVYLVAVLPASLVSERSTTPRAYWLGVGLAATAAVAWSCSTLSIAPALALVDVPTAAAIRTPLAAALLFLAAGRARVLPEAEHLRGRALIAVAATGLTSLGATLFFLISVSLAGAGRAAVLTATSPLFAVPFSVLLLGERGNWRIVAGTVLSVVGVIFLAQT